MQLYAESAFLSDGWARDVVFNIGDDGRIAGIEREVKRRPAGAARAAGPVLPGMPNLHSHAFQRALAGYAERRGPGEDSFWGWRRVMYDLVARLTPEQVQDIAAHTYVEMLKAGYTSVGEFHYLHHDPEGQPYAALTEMSDRVIAAAHAAGIAITHLPVLYAHGGFGGRDPEPAQRRFVSTPERYARLLEALFERYRGDDAVRLGIAPHSLRAITPELLREATALVSALDPAAPIHLHIAEQRREVDDCITWCRCRPIEWLLDTSDVNERWCLVHATHAEAGEVTRMARSGAVVGLCPTTEANLGDGVFSAAAYVGAGGRFGIGSDSHISISPIEELRMLEYGQRLVRERRTVLSGNEVPSVGRRLYVGAARGGAQALGRAAGALAVGHRADLVVLDPQTPALWYKPGDLLFDAVVFAGNVNPVRDVLVGGRWRVVERRHAQEDEIAARFRQVQRTVRVEG
ncbi:MAG: formimidoylglutamate deiminase [Gammaproteobacteria bacterium]|nr:formimidoylglutamate deiminase [Gammaproteobacteria bacterium]NIR83455.1 formimidoylglutamate deiminase [Gammaproteobacteria bacterium]NIR91377.1 formimidoylglutamate deiminase [Gammaproteobacteria bacterium]NIU04617.1 formimidoylglutamate deiminase [Gammaproteobacteria bacterium]NIV51659.1 formimidoylglutamate deiminase [Gammaproteobacteria bacterium]